MQRTAPVDADALVADHLPLVSHIVASVASRLPSHVGRDELVSAGMYGLVQAAKAFDPQRHVEFMAFARTRIRGSVLDELRSRDWASRSVRGMARQAEAAADDLTSTLARTPTAAEIAGRLGVDVSALSQLAADVERASLVSYESIVLGGAVEPMAGATGVDPESQLMARERCAYLNDAVATLPDRMRIVIQGLFVDDRNGAEIAAELGVTEARVSQIRSEALALLREGMQAHLDAPAAPPPRQGTATKRKAAYFAAVGAASDYRTRLNAPPADVAERVVTAGA